VEKKKNYGPALVGALLFAALIAGVILRIAQGG
jgi:hypothetical protein